MTVEILFSEVCSLYGDVQNPVYLQKCLPDAKFVFTSLTDEPYFVHDTPDLIYLGGMPEQIQRRVIGKLMPYRERIRQIVEADVPILATGNACEVFTRHISYLTEGIETDGLGLVDLTVKTDLMNRFNSKVWGQTAQGITVLGYRSQFSFLYGDNSENYFLRCLRGEGINPESKLEGFRIHNLIGTQLLGPILPNNPQFCEYFLSLAGVQTEAAFKEAAMTAFRQRLKEFQDPTTAYITH
ncbi:MAG: hypothetical protein PUF71_01170 [Firmicutes bacterium]|nr:hypothetical protein [Bacillota bacterium]